MKRYVGIGAALCLAAGVAGCSGEDAAAPAPAPGPKAAVTFDVTDEAGHWFDTGAPLPGGSRSLAIVKPGDRVRFLQTRSEHGPASANGASRVEAFHTVTSLIWPAGTKPAERIDQDKANKDDHDVVLRTPGLHVFVCKLHPYMLAGVIVDDPDTKTATGDPALDISDKNNGDKLHLYGVTHTGDVRKPTDDSKAFTSNSNLGLRLLRAFFVVTTPSNWKDYTKVTTPATKYQPAYPPVTVRVNPVGALALPDGIVPDLNAALTGFIDGENITALTAPATPGVGEVWVDTQYEESAGKGKAYPSTVTVVDAATWQVKRKIALPDEKMNNAHNLWASHDQKYVYNTEWHGKSLYVHKRDDFSLVQELELGNDPAHVMTRVDTAQVHVGLNGEDAVVELNAAANGTVSFNPARPGGKGRILVQNPGDKQAQPHAHWMGHDGKSMVTPNSNTNDSTLFDFNNYSIKGKNETGTLPIASSIMPDSSKYYVSNYLGHSISVMNGPQVLNNYTGVGGLKGAGPYQPGEKIKDIPLLNPGPGGNYNILTGPTGAPIGGLPIQTPVSPDGKFVITGNTLTGTITIIDTATDTLVAMVPCDPGCHGVNFGAKVPSAANPAGGYYAYVTSKFSNRLIVLDYDPNGDGNVSDATVAGSVVLVSDDPAKTDDPISGNKGMGGQGVLPVPNVYNGWVQKLPSNEGADSFCGQLTPAQRSPFSGTVITPCAP